MQSLSSKDKRLTSLPFGGDGSLGLLPVKRDPARDVSYSALWVSLAVFLVVLVLLLLSMRAFPFMRWLVTLLTA